MAELRVHFAVCLHSALCGGGIRATIEIHLSLQTNRVKKDFVQINPLHLWVIIKWYKMQCKIWTWWSEWVSLARCCSLALVVSQWTFVFDSALANAWSGISCCFSREFVSNHSNVRLALVCHTLKLIISAKDTITSAVPMHACNDWCGRARCS